MVFPIMVPMHVFILAGGFATRLWPLTERRAKPLLPLAGKPLLDHMVERLPAGIPVTVSTNAEFEDAFLAWKLRSNRPGIHIHIEKARTDEEKLGALGAFAQWVVQKGIREDVLLLTGDNYFGFDFSTFLGHFREGIPLLAAVDLGDRAKARAFGTVLLDESFSVVTGFEEKPVDPKSSIVSTGCSLIPADLLPLLVVFAQRHPDNVGGLFEEFLRRGFPVDCRVFTEPWFDIGSFDSYLAATRALVGERVLCGKGAHIEGSESRGSVVLGDRSVIHKSIVRDCVLFDDCRVEDCVLEHCILDNGCVVKGIDLSGKMLRAGTKLMK